MIDPLSRFLDQAVMGAQALLEFGTHLVNPTVRLGVTGMSNAGKTVFITALVHALMQGGRFPVFEAMASGRVCEARLAPQPDDAVPRFDYENHVRALVLDRDWPESTRRISELRLVIEYQSQRAAMRTLTLDIVDYPGEWLLDLPLLDMSYEKWSAESLALSRQQPRAALASHWHDHLRALDPLGPADEHAALTATALFSSYLKSCRRQQYALSMLPPGRFLMPGDLAGSPALTFVPLDIPQNGVAAPHGSLWSMMRRRYDSYKRAIVQPFYREHFARLDRQIVLVDVLSALNAGPEALRDLEGALASVLACFSAGRKSVLSTLFSPRIDRILFAATKADHLHQSSHDQLEAVLRRLTESALQRVQIAGAQVDVVALAAIRATREAMIRLEHSQLPAILGTPAAGEVLGEQMFDGKTEVAIFPGELPADPELLFMETDAFRGLTMTSAQHADFRFLRLRPPLLESGHGEKPFFPHIRLDRALQFLIGDRLP